MMRKIKIIRVILSLVLMLLTAVLIILNLSDIAERVQVMTAAVSLSIGVCAFWLVITLALGRIYCSTVCPLGTVQDVVSWISKRYRNHGKGYYRFSPAENRLRYVVLLLIVVSVIAGQYFISNLSDPYKLFKNLVDLCTGHMEVTCSVLGCLASLIVLVAIIYLAQRSGRTFCNTFCPVGSTLGYVSKYSVFRFEIDPDLCTNCGLCELECKSSCVNAKEHTIDVSRCVVCFDCAAVCPANAIKFKASRKRLSTPMMQKIPDLSVKADKE
jgi:polyferredoxin